LFEKGDEISGHEGIYLDDLLVASRSVEEHRRHLRQVLQLLQANGLVINAEKCLFGQTSLEFLGHLVQADGIRPLPDRVPQRAGTTRLTANC
jgi:Reverse transcriptase (RNA-dependent DNA polymerase)